MEVCSHNQLDPNTVLLKINGTSCNLHCHYCSEIKKKKNSRMPIEYIQDIFENLPNETSIILHGGEPLLDAKYIEEIIHLFCASRNGRLFIQTNGCFDNDMLQVLLENRKHIGIGVSLDGPDEQSSYRTTQDEEPTFNTVDSLLTVLCENEIEVKCIATIHKLNYRYPDVFLKYFSSKNNITQLRINPCFDVTKNGLAHYAIRPFQFFSFLEDIFREWICQSLFSKIRIDPIHAAFEQVLAGNRILARNCSKFISIYPQYSCTLCDSLGNISFTCSDWKNLFSQASSIARTELMDKCATCIDSSLCDFGCIAIINRFKQWPDLLEEYCRYRKDFFSMIQKTALNFSEKK